MCTIAALTSQTVFIPREIMYFSRNMSRFYHGRQKMYRVNNFLSRKHSLFSFVVHTWTIPRTCYSAESKINFPECLTKEKAKEIASKLSSEERDLFLKVLKEYKSEEDKAGYQRNYFLWRVSFDCRYLCKHVFINIKMVESKKIVLLTNITNSTRYFIYFTCYVHSVHSYFFISLK